MDTLKILISIIGGTKPFEVRYLHVINPPLNDLELYRTLAACSCWTRCHIYLHDREVQAYITKFLREQYKPLVSSDPTKSAINRRKLQGAINEVMEQPESKISVRRGFLKLCGLTSCPKKVKSFYDTSRVWNSLLAKHSHQMSWLDCQTTSFDVPPTGTETIPHVYLMYASSGIDDTEEIEIQALVRSITSWCNTKHEKNLRFVWCDQSLCRLLLVAHTGSELLESLVVAYPDDEKMSTTTAAHTLMCGRLTREWMKRTHTRIPVDFPGPHQTKPDKELDKTYVQTTLVTLRPAPPSSITVSNSTLNPPISSSSSTVTIPSSGGSGSASLSITTVNKRRPLTAITNSSVDHTHLSNFIVHASPKKKAKKSTKKSTEPANTLSRYYKLPLIAVR